MSTAQPPEIPAADPNKVLEQVKTETAIEQQKPGAMPLEVSIPGTPQVFRGSTPQELLDELVKAQTNASQLIKQQKDELERLKTAQQQIQQQQQAEPKTPANEYDPNKYYELWQKDPREANRYLAQFDPQQKEAQQVISNLRQEAEVRRFRANTGFAPESNPEVAQKFADAFVQSKLQPTAENMELIYNRMVLRGEITPPITANVNPTHVPPTLNASAGTTAGFDMVAFANLPVEKQAEVIERLAKAGTK